MHNRLSVDLAVFYADDLVGTYYEGTVISMELFLGSRDSKIEISIKNSK